MAHVRKQIRSAMVTALTGLTTTGSNVFESRVYDLASAKLPAIAVYSVNENLAYQSIGSNRLQLRSSIFGVEIYVKSASGYDATLDQITVEVEEALYANRTFGGLAQDMKVMSLNTEVSDQGDMPIIYGTLEVEIQYQTDENDPETAI
jgi:hypothetical protein